ncbi:hypothetical protein BM221_001569 [Beauveria bassiana]|uniref:Uncharacterized protein n=1 Tax=Beauveria bassiana TaxID=176275 RepID=A0A2N6NW35_BEABA|nr:hypothetical protein BM221_001569 [Beauveria bassiana]
MLKKIACGHCHAETQPKRIVAAQKEPSQRCLFLFPNQFGHVDAPARHVALADAQVDATRQVLAQLRAQRPHFGLAQRRGLFLLALAPTAATASEPCAAVRLKLVLVVLDAELVGRAAQPRVLAVRFFLCQHRVRQLLGQVRAGLEPRDNLLVKRQRGASLLLPLRVDFGGEAPRGEHLVGPAEQDADAGAGAARGAPGAVHVSVGGARHVVVQDEVDGVNVEAARGNVGGDEHAAGGGGEALEGAQPRLLRHLRVQRLRGHVEVLQKGRDAPHRRDGVCKDEGAAAGVQEQHRVQVQVLFHGAALDQALAQTLCHLLDGVGVNVLGLAAKLEALHQVRHLFLVCGALARRRARLARQLGLQALVKRGRKDERLPRRRGPRVCVLILLFGEILVIPRVVLRFWIATVQRPDDQLRLLELARLEQPVGLVDNQKLNPAKFVLQLHVAVEHLPQAAGRANHNVRLGQLPLLLLDAQPARHHAHVRRRRRRQPVAQRLDVVANLLGQLARRAQNHCYRTFALLFGLGLVLLVGALVQLQPALDNRDAKGQRLARACLRLANDVGAARYVRNRLLLNRGRAGKAQLANGRDGRRREVQRNPLLQIQAAVVVFVICIHQHAKRIRVRVAFLLLARLIRLVGIFFHLIVVVVIAVIAVIAKTFKHFAVVAVRLLVLGHRRLTRRRVCHEKRHAVALPDDVDTLNDFEAAKVLAKSLPGQRAGILDAMAGSAGLAAFAALRIGPGGRLLLAFFAQRSHRCACWRSRAEMTAVNVPYSMQLVRSEIFL